MADPPAWPSDALLAAVLPLLRPSSSPRPRPPLLRPRPAWLPHPRRRLARLRGVVRPRPGHQ